MFSLKIDPRMLQAIRDQAEKEFLSMASLIKKAVQQYLESKGIDWKKVKVPTKK